MVDNLAREEVYEEVDAPQCFGFFDDLDPSCSKRCQFRVECIEEQEELKPGCYSKLHDEGSGTCQACILASQCIEEQMAQEAKEMVKRKLKVRRRAAAVPEPEPQEAENENEDARDYTGMRVAELREELEDRELDTTGRKSVLVERLMEDDEAVDEPEPEPEPKPKRKRKPRRKATPRAKPAPEPEPEPEDSGIVISTIDELFQGMEIGKAISITRVGDGQYLMSAGEPTVAVPVKKGQGLRGDPYWVEVLTEEYYEFMNVDCGEGKPWTEMSVDEKFAFADDMDIEWEDSDDDRVSLMRMIKVMFAELGIVKYKAEYKSKAARDALR